MGADFIIDWMTCVFTLWNKDMVLSVAEISPPEKNIYRLFQSSYDADTYVCAC